MTLLDVLAGWATLSVVVGLLLGAWVKHHRRHP